MVNFVAGTGSYEDTRAFSPTQEDVEEQRREMKQVNPQCSQCLDELRERMKSGVDRSDIDVDPYMDLNFWVTEQEADYSDDHELRKTGHAMAYCEEHEEEFVLYEETWFSDEEEEEDYSTS